jgi:hypothetical protein
LHSQNQLTLSLVWNFIHCNKGPTTNTKSLKTFLTNQNPTTITFSEPMHCLFF